jgi:hypothetical protein
MPSKSNQILRFQKSSDSTSCVGTVGDVSSAGACDSWKYTISYFVAMPVTTARKTSSLFATNVTRHCTFPGRRLNDRWNVLLAQSIPAVFANSLVGLRAHRRQISERTEETPRKHGLRMCRCIP